MEFKLIIILAIYFLIGAVLSYAINKSKNLYHRKLAWIKYFTYLFIISILFISILYHPITFHYIGIVIILSGFGEIIITIIKTNKLKSGLFTLFIYTISSFAFFRFSQLNQPILLFTLTVVTVFDASSQLSGQLFGKRKMLSVISPNKTLEGLIGGFFYALLTSFLIRNLLDLNVIVSIILGTGVSIFAFTGDLLASLSKRKFGIKDYSNLIPGHGGFLDRFDSLIFSGLFMFIISNIFNL